MLDALQIAQIRPDLYSIELLKVQDDATSPKSTDSFMRALL
jgi:hypothetical protein